MRSFIPTILLTAALLEFVPGCNSLPETTRIVAPDIGQHPIDVRGVQLDPHQVPRYGDVQQELDRFKMVSAARPLSDAECACLAASRSRLAHVLEKEAAHLQSQGRTHHAPCPTSLLPQILRDRAAKERNDAARQALLAYYQLVEVHLQNSLLDESAAEFQRTRQVVDRLSQAGVALQVDRTQLDRDRLQLNLRSVQLRVNEARLATQVKTLIGEDPFSPEAIETCCSVNPRGVGYSLPEAMEIARANDFELKAIRRFLHCGGIDDLDVARSLLQGANPLLGQAPVKLPFLLRLATLLSHDDRDAQELRQRKSQLRELEQARRQQVDLEVAGAVVNVQEQLLSVGIAKDMLDSWQRRVELLESQRELQQSNYQDVVQARAEMLKAKSDLLHQLVLLEMEHVKLRGSLGLLGQECDAAILPSRAFEPAPVPGVLLPPNHGG